MFQVNPLLGFTRKIKPYFLRKIKLKNKKNQGASNMLNTKFQPNISRGSGGKVDLSGIAIF